MQERFRKLIHLYSVNQILVLIIVFGLWEENRVCAENPCEYRENMEASQKKALAGNPEPCRRVATVLFTPAEGSRATVY